MSNLGTLVAMVAFAAFLHTPAAAADSSAPRQAERARLTLHNTSWGQKVRITANDKVVWDAIVEAGAFEPVVHTIDLPVYVGEPCRIRVSGGPYNAALRVNWKKGHLVVLDFERSGATIQQLEKSPNFL